LLELLEQPKHFIWRDADPVSRNLQSKFPVLSAAMDQPPIPRPQ